MQALLELDLKPPIRVAHDQAWLVERCRAAYGAAIAETEPRAMPGTRDHTAFERSLVQRTARVRADVGERADAVAGARQHDAHAARFHDVHTIDGDIVGLSRVGPVLGPVEKRVVVDAVADAEHDVTPDPRPQQQYGKGDGRQRYCNRMHTLGTPPPERERHCVDDHHDGHEQAVRNCKAPLQPECVAEVRVACDQR